MTTRVERRIKGSPKPRQNKLVITDCMCYSDSNTISLCSNYWQIKFIIFDHSFVQRQISYYTIRNILYLTRTHTHTHTPKWTFTHEQQHFIMTTAHFISLFISNTTVTYIIHHSTHCLQVCYVKKSNMYLEGTLYRYNGYAPSYNQCTLCPQQFRCI